MREKPCQKPSFTVALSLIRRLRRHLPPGEGLSSAAAWLPLGEAVIKPKAQMTDEGKRTFSMPTSAAVLSLIRRLRRHLPPGEGLLHRLPLLASLGGSEPVANGDFDHPVNGQKGGERAALPSVCRQPAPGEGLSSAAAWLPPPSSRSPIPYPLFCSLIYSKNPFPASRIGAIIECG